MHGSDSGHTCNHQPSSERASKETLCHPKSNRGAGATALRDGVCKQPGAVFT